MKLVLATGNAGKVREMASQLASCGIEVLSRKAFTEDEPVEDGLTFVENALIKARHASAVSGLPAVADDSGIRVAALDGAPGVHSARFAGPDASDEDNWRKLLGAMEHVPEVERVAAFHCTLAFLRSASDPAPVVVSAEWSGHVLFAPRGVQGFGYDPVFRPEGMTCSAAELKPEEKQAVSHRAQALRVFLSRIEALVGS